MPVSVPVYPKEGKKMENKKIEVIIKLKENEVNISPKYAGDTDDKGQFIVKYYASPKIPYVDTKHIISFALKREGYNDREINDILEGAEDIDEYRDIVRKVMSRIKEKYIKVTFLYPKIFKDKYENIYFLQEGYVEKEIIEKIESIIKERGD
ncbi:MAG: hypothetical protein ACP5T9_06540 [Thermoplasmata archaeon]